MTWRRCEGPADSGAQRFDRGRGAGPPLGSAAVPDAPAVDAASRLAPITEPVAAAAALVEHLAPHAAAVERDGVTRSTLDRLAGAGLHGILGPIEAGGSGTPMAVYRKVAELLAGADGNTWFVWFQHNPVVKLLAASENDVLRTRWLRPLCAGTTQAGVAFSHVRAPQPVVRAEPAPGGWRFTGTVAWCTGWGLADLVLLGGTAPDGRVVLALVPMAPGPGVEASAPLALAAMGGTATVMLRLDRLAVSDEQVLSVTDGDAWAAADALTNANVQPSTFGVARAALDALRGTDGATAAVLSPRLDEVRDRAYRLADEVTPDESVEPKLAARAEALLLGVEITSAYVASVGGRAMDLAHPAQRWAREALFHLVQAQTRPVRHATLAGLRARRS